MTFVAMAGPDKSEDCGRYKFHLRNGGPGQVVLAKTKSRTLFTRILLGLVKIAERSGDNSCAMRSWYIPARAFSIPRSLNVSAENWIQNQPVPPGIRAVTIAKSKFFSRGHPGAILMFPLLLLSLTMRERLSSSMPQSLQITRNWLQDKEILAQSLHFRAGCFSKYFA